MSRPSSRLHRIECELERLQGQYLLIAGKTDSDRIAALAESLLWRIAELDVEHARLKEEPCP